MRAMVHPLVFNFDACRAIEWLFRSKQYLADCAQATACDDSQNQPLRPIPSNFCRRFHGRELRQSRHARVKMPPHYYSTLARSMFAEWGLKSKRTLAWGVPSTKLTVVRAFSRNDESCPG